MTEASEAGLEEGFDFEFGGMVGVGGEESEGEGAIGWLRRFRWKGGEPRWREWMRRRCGMIVLDFEGDEGGECEEGERDGGEEFGGEEGFLARAVRWAAAGVVVAQVRVDWRVVAGRGWAACRPGRAAVA